MADIATSPELRQRRTRANNKNSNGSGRRSQITAKDTTTEAAAVSSTTISASDGDSGDDATTATTMTTGNANRPEDPNSAQSSSDEDDDDDQKSTSTSHKPAVIGDDDSVAVDAFRLHIHFDPVTVLLFIVALATRVHRLAEPNHIVFDELHYGKYVSLYMRRTFFFDQHPPLGKQLIAGAAWLAGYRGNFTFSRIGAEYSSVGRWVDYCGASC